MLLLKGGLLSAYKLNVAPHVVPFSSVYLRCSIVIWKVLTGRSGGHLNVLRDTSGYPGDTSPIALQSLAWIVNIEYGCAGLYSAILLVLQRHYRDTQRSRSNCRRRCSMPCPSKTGHKLKRIKQYICKCK